MDSEKLKRVFGAWKGYTKNPNIQTETEEEEPSGGYEVEFEDEVEELIVEFRRVNILVFNPFFSLKLFRG